jgi:hypothetical protein
MDGDSQPSGPISSRLWRAAALLAVLWGALLAPTAAAWLGGGRSGCAGCPSRSQLPIMRGARAASGWPAWGLCWAAWCKAILRPLYQACNWGPWALAPGRDRERGRERERERDREASLWKGAPCSGCSQSPSARLRWCPWWGCALGACANGAQTHWHTACGRLGIEPGSRAAWWAGAAAAAVSVAAALALGAAAVGAWYFLSIWWDWPTAAVAVAVEGQLSKFTLLTMTYTARMPTLGLFVQHYSRCPSGEPGCQSHELCLL